MAKKFSWRTGKSTEGKNSGQTRRTILGRAGIALLAGLGGVFTPKMSVAGPAKGGLETSPTEITRVKSKLSPPTPAEFVKLGECLSYLSNMPAGARVFDATRAVGEFVDIVRDRELPSTRQAARSIWGLRCTYGIGSTLLSEESKRRFAERMLPVRRALEAEIGVVDVSCSGLSD